MIQQLGKPLEELYNTIKGEKSALLIGNGKSRNDIDLNELSKNYDITFGCNILYREFWPDYLITKNKSIMERDYLMGNVWKKAIIIHTVQGGFDYDVNKLDISKFFYLSPRWNNAGGLGNSGHIIVHAAAKMGFKKIDILGFDMDMTNIFRGQHRCYEQCGASIHHWNQRKDQIDDIIKEHSEIDWKQINSQTFSCKSIILK